MKAVVIGLDGAGFELIDPWVEAGDLPNIARIKRQGVWANMRSVLPPVTSPNWKCFTTGKNPGKIGIFWWEHINWKNRRVYYPTARKFKNKEIWDYIGEMGMKCGVVGMPTTYPPRKVNGFIISGAPDAEEGGFTYPPELEEELKLQGWKIRPKNIIDIDREKACHEIDEIINSYFQTADILTDRYKVDFFMLAIFHCNTLHHFLWDSPETKRAWRIIDNHIGNFMAQGCDLIIMSDHGSNKIESVFNINTWLKEQGYLYLNINPGTAILNRLGINQQSLVNLASKLRMLEFLRRIVPKRIFKYIPSETGEVQREAKTGKINWRKSKALATGQGPIYLNPENTDNEMLREEIKRKLEALVDPVTGEKVIEGLYTKEEIYHGRYLVEAPDLIVDQAKGVHIPGGVGQKHVFETSRRWQAENKKFGLFMAYGADIKSGGKIENVSILDLAPTILHLMNVPVPAEMDGRVLKEIFREDSEPAQREVKYQRTELERGKAKLKERIKKVRESHKL